MPSRPEPRGPHRAAALLLPLLLAVAGLAACGPRYVRTPIIETPLITVKLRAEKAAGGTRDRGYSHPATVSGIRLAHILSRVDVRPKGGEGDRRGAVPTELLYDLGDAISAALAKADPTQEVSVQALRTDRSLGLFTNRYYTSFLVWVKGDDMYMHFSRSDDLLAKGEEDEMREARLGVETQKFKVIVADGIQPVGEQTVSIDWRNARFREASHLRVDEKGQVRRRQVLMEGEPEEEGAPGGAAPPTAPLPDDPEILRALADLEDDRRDGLLTEVEYNRRRERLLWPEGRP